MPLTGLDPQDARRVNLAQNEARTYRAELWDALGMNDDV